MTTKIYQKEISIDSTHIMLKTDKQTRIEDFIIKQRQIISNEIKRNPQFEGYNPINIIKKPRILELMTKAGQIAEIGPMSAVAGSMSQICLEHLIKKGSKFSIIENGGDIALRTNKEITLGIYAGKSIYTNNIGLKIKPKKDGYGICTSSGTVGPSESFGKTDAVIIFSKTASIADSLATRIANYGNGKTDKEIVENALEKAEQYKKHYDGVIVIKGEYLAKTGHIPELVNME